LTAFNFVLENDRVCVAMDTLVVDPQTKAPHKFVSKIFPLLHLRGILCGTGTMQVILDWFVLIQSGAFVGDMIHLGQFAPEALRRIGAKYAAETTGTTTIYHFGFDRAKRSFRGFAFRSEQNYGLEEVPYGIGTKPPISIGAFQSLPDAFIDIIARQRERDRAEPVEKQVGIGGEIQFAVLTQDHLAMTTCHTFEDYDACLRRVLCRGEELARTAAG
jgi:hypothetical protein